MRILITTFGTDGDVYPYLAIGRRLAARGHDPVIATGERHRETIEASGIAFRPIGPLVDPEDTELFARAMDPRRGPEVGIREILMPGLRESYADTLGAAREADAIVTHPITYAGPIVAEVTGLPWISTVLAPLSLFSRHDLPVIPVAPRLKRLEGLPGARPALSWLFRRVTRAWADPVRELRAELGLPPPAGDPIYEGQHSPACALGLFSRVLARPQPDWPLRTRLTGFPFHDLTSAVDEEARRLAEFLDAGPAPIVFTLGSSVVRVAGSFFTESLAAVRQLGLRAVLLVGDEPGNRPAGSFGDDAIAIGRAPHHALFPRAAVVVHHGGIGTLGQALRAGRPMLIVPRSHDQPDNAHRAERLGVARVHLHPWPYRARRVAKKLQALLEDPRYAARATEVGAVVRGEDGVRDACDAIEEAVLRG